MEGIILNIFKTGIVKAQLNISHFILYHGTILFNIMEIKYFSLIITRIHIPILITIYKKSSLTLSQEQYVEEQIYVRLWQEIMLIY